MISKNNNKKVKTFIKIEYLSKIRKVLSLVLIFLLALIVFLRWVGIISPLIFNWKKPVVSEIQNIEFIEQKNDQLWVNLNYDQNHSLVQKEVIYIKDIENGRIYDEQELIEGNNTYIFRNIPKGDYLISYEIKWSLFGQESKSFEYTMANVNTFDFNPATNVARDEEDVTLEINREGDFLDLNGETTAGLYYINTGFANKIKDLKLNHNGVSKSKAKRIFNLFQKGWNQNVLIKQASIDDGVNFISFDRIVVDKAGNEEILKENTTKKYVLVPAGLVEVNNKIYMVISFPINAYTYGIPRIDNFSSKGNSQGDIEINNSIEWEENNYDRSGEEYIQIDLYSIHKDQTRTLINKQYLSLDDFLKNGLTYKKILRNEEYFEAPVSKLDILEWEISLQIKYGYEINVIPVIDEDGPKNSNKITKTFSMSYEEKPPYDYYSSYMGPDYVYDIDSNGQVTNASILWNSATWWDLPDPTSKGQLYFKIYDQSNGSYTDWILDDEIGTKSYIYFTEQSSPPRVIENGDLIGDHIVDFKKDKIFVRLDIITSERNWWNEDSGEYRVRPFYLSPIN